LGSTLAASLRRSWSILLPALKTEPVVMRAGYVFSNSEPLELGLDFSYESGPPAVVVIKTGLGPGSV